MTPLTNANCDNRKLAGIGLVFVISALWPSLANAQPRDADLPSPYQSAVRQPSMSEENQLFWSSMLKITPRGVSSKAPEGCFKAEYPNKKWIKIPCGPPSQQPNSVGNGIDYFTQTTGTITKAVGSFPSVFGGLNEVGQVPKVTTLNSNTYMLQLNTNRFAPASVCKGSTSCSVWQQFLFSNKNQCGGKTACVFMEYWIFNPPGLAAGKCPTGWAYSAAPGTRPGCYFNTPTVFVPFQSTAVLGQLQLAGQIIGGGVDQVVFAPSAKPFLVFTTTWGDVVGLSGGWKGAEYNVFGDCCALEAFFKNSKTTITVKLQTTSGTTAAPSCNSSFSGATAETNDLNLVPSSCTATSGTSTAISFQESNACTTPSCSLPVTIAFHQVGACNGFASALSGVGASAGSNAAYVIFAVDSIDNSKGTTAFSFDPTNLFVPQALQADFFDPNLSLYPNILGPLASVAATVAPGARLDFSPSGFGALVVATNNANGAQEASTTPFALQYNQQPSDPPVTMVNSQPGVTDFTPWPLTEDCHSVKLQ